MILYKLRLYFIFIFSLSSSIALAEVIFNETFENPIPSKNLRTNKSSVNFHGWSTGKILASYEFKEGGILINNTTNNRGIHSNSIQIFSKLGDSYTVSTEFNNLSLVIPKNFINHPHSIFVGFASANTGLKYFNSLVDIKNNTNEANSNEDCIYVAWDNNVPNLSQGILKLYAKNAENLNKLIIRPSKFWVNNSNYKLELTLTLLDLDKALFEVQYKVTHLNSIDGDKVVTSESGQFNSPQILQYGVKASIYAKRALETNHFDNLDNLIVSHEVKSVPNPAEIKKAEEAKKLATEKKAQELKAKEDAKKKADNKAKRLKEEADKKRAEAAKLAAEKKAQELKAKEDAKKKADARAKRLAENKAKRLKEEADKKRAEAAKLAAEKKAKENAAKTAAEEAKAKRIAAQQKAKEDAKKKAAEAEKTNTSTMIWRVETVANPQSKNFLTKDGVLLTSLNFIKNPSKKLKLDDILFNPTSKTVNRYFRIKNLSLTADNFHPNSSSILNEGIYSNNKKNITISLTNLHIGKTYYLDLIIANNRDSDKTKTFSINGTSYTSINYPNNDQFLILKCEFVVTQVIQEINLTATKDQFIQLNALQLRSKDKLIKPLTRAELFKKFENYLVLLI